VTGSTRTVLFLSALILIAAAGGLMSSKGESFLLPVILMLTSAAAVMGYGILYAEKNDDSYSSSLVKVDESIALDESIEVQEEVVDPVEMGFEIPVL